MIKINKFLKNGAVLMGMCLMLGVISAQAALLTVVNTADAGPGSLRQAILDATANGAANTIIFAVPPTDPGYDVEQNRFTIDLLTSLPDIPLAPLTIENNQAQAVIVKGNNTFRIMTLVNSAVVTITNLTISNGASAIIARGRTSRGSGIGDGLGGGIYMGDSSTLNLNGSTVSDNIASGNGGGIYMSNSSTLNIFESTFRSNTASNGGGIFINDSGTLNIRASTINSNVANNGGSGGGIFNGTSGTVNAINNTINANSASNNGGGIYNSATITFTNNTVSSNIAAKGGGIYNNFTATLNNNLVALNTAFDGNDLLGRGSLGIAFTGTYNLVGNADGSEGLGATNQLGTTTDPIPPQIGSLRDNGGKTFTRALFPGSPALDQGNSPVVITDQRGHARPHDNLLVNDAPGGNGADIGAFEGELAPTSADVSISGRVLTSGERKGTELSGATVSLTNMAGEIKTTNTNPFGYYRFEGVGTGETYVISVSDKRYKFEVKVISVVEDMTDLNFVALPTTIFR